MSARKTTMPDSWTLDLNAPGMTPVHRAGLGGLAATLRALSPEHGPEGASWKLDETSITLEAPGALDELVKRIVKHGLAIGDDGLIAFPALGDPPSGTRLLIQRALLGTFLQGGWSRKLQKSERQLVLDPGSQNVPDSYRPMAWFRHQCVADDILSTLRDHSSARIAGYFFPGAAEKHPGRKWSRMHATAEQLMALAFAPVGCVPFLVQNQAAGARQRFALVIPDVDNLLVYADLRRHVAKWSPVRLTVASAADAALQLAISDDSSIKYALRQGRRFCTVVALGIQPWATQQKTRTGVLEIAPPSEAARFNYRLVSEGIIEFQPRHLPRKDGSGTFVATSAGRGAIAEALAIDRPWWAAVSETYRRSNDFREAVHYLRERKGLAKMVEQARWDREEEKLFVQASHAAMRALYGSIGERTSAVGTDFDRKAATEMTKIRSSLLRAKNADNFRDALLEFWSRASRSKVRTNPVLRSSEDGEATPVWERILPLLDDQHWRKARDLALLALISYPGSEQPAESQDDESSDESS